MLNQLSPVLVILVIAVYFFLLMLISGLTGRQDDNSSFFNANRSSPWILVAIGMIGASLSGVTFISIPGVVGAEGKNMAFSYMQMVFGYLLGYLVIAHVLMPVYYRMQLSSIYGYLESRFGFYAYKTGAAYFLLSRIIGASFRLFLVALVLQIFVMDHYGLPLWLTVAITILLIWVYTFRGGIKTIVWTDTLQTVCMLTAVILTLFAICRSMNVTVLEIPEMIRNAGLGKIFFFEKGWVTQIIFSSNLLVVRLSRW